MTEQTAVVNPAAAATTAFFAANPSSTVKEAVAALTECAEKDVRRFVAGALTDGTLVVVGRRPQTDANGKPSRGRPSNLISVG